MRPGRSRVSLLGPVALDELQDTGDCDEDTDDDHDEVRGILTVEDSVDTHDDHDDTHDRGQDLPVVVQREGRGDVRQGHDTQDDQQDRQEDLARRYLSVFGLSGFAERYPARLSGGQQQRVAIARMMAATPAIYLLDEPMSALDAYLKSALEQTLLDLFDVLDATVLYVSHDIDEACRLCDRIAVMHEGRVVEVGSPRELLRAPRTLAALRLTGCKNTSPARKVSDTVVEALDWGMTFDVGAAVPDDIAYLGVRASYFHEDNRAEPGRNTYDLKVARVSDSRFERLVLLDPPRADSPSRLQWKIDLRSAGDRELPEAGDVLRMHFDARRIHLVCR